MAWNTKDDWKNALDTLGMLDFFRDTQIPDLAGILSDGNWEAIFHQFAQSEYSSENVDFLRAVAVFEASGDLNQAAEIYKEYIPTSAARQVNISDAARKDLEGIFGDGKDGIGPPSVYDAAKDQVFKMLRGDTYARFKAEGEKAQTALAQDIDWNNVEGRERS